MQDKHIDELKEKLAAIEHERWADWQKWCHKVIRENPAQLEFLLANWDKQIETPYDKLTDREKAADMEQVDRYWPLIQEYITTEQLAILERLKRESRELVKFNKTEPLNVGEIQNVELIRAVPIKAIQQQIDKIGGKE